VSRGRYRIEYTPEASEHLGALSAYQQALVLDRVEKQLRHQPTIATRNRKLLRANPIAAWELRVGSLRVYFDVDELPDRVVTVRAVGLKVRERVIIGAHEVELG
jgi:mRNA-degrading endonuclease RelE of RelBE toxin-antitoxin system